MTLATGLTVFFSTIVGVTILLLSVGIWYIKSPLLLPITPQNPVVKASKQRLYGHVDFLSGIQPARSFEYPTSLDTAAEYIASELGKCKKAMVQRQYFQVGNKTFQNIRAVFGDTLANHSRVVIGAHYDVCGNQAGADDNASAVAGLLEIAYLLGQYNQQLPCPVELVAYSLEEPPNFRTKNMGSYIHAKSLKDSKIDVKLMICLEMLGYYSDAPSSQEYPIGLLKTIYPTVGNFIGLVGNLKDRKVIKELKSSMKKYGSVPVESINAPASIRGIDFSDHQNYWLMGYPAVMITDTAFFRNPNYHQPSDTIATLDFDRMAAVVTALYAALGEIATK